MRSKLERYYTQRTHKILHYLQIFEKSVGEKDLHEFRVELKKMRAILRFLRNEYGKADIKKTRTAVDLLFREAGTLREQQLVLTWLGKNRLQKLYKFFISENPVPETSRQLQKVQRAIRKKLINRFAGSRQLTEKTPQSVTDVYAAKLKHYIEESLRTIPAQPEWHTLRKHIKQWLYAVNWTTNSQSTSLSHLYTYSNQLQEAIGNWHDAITQHITLLSLQFHLPQDSNLKKEHASALQKIQVSIQHRAKAVEQLLHHSGLTGKKFPSLT